MNLAFFQEQIYPIRSKLFRFALRITGSMHDAEDVVQEVLEKVWKSGDAQSQAVQNWEAWCMTMTRNRSIDRARLTQSRRTSTLESSADRASEMPSPAATTEQGDMVAQIRQLMQQLPEKQRLVMHLRDVEELAYDEIAAALEISLDQVKVNLHRARKAIRDKFLKLDVVQR